MGLFDNLFDKREKIDYCKGCDFLFDVVWMQAVQFIRDFNDLSNHDYRAELISIIAAYLDTKPKEKAVRVCSTFGTDMIYYGTVHAPREFKDIYLPKYKDKHKHYSCFIRDNTGNSINTTTSRTLALEICRLNGIAPEPAKVDAITIDINKMVELVDATLSTYRFV